MGTRIKNAQITNVVDGQRMDVEFDTDDPVMSCLRRHVDSYGNVLCHVWKGKTNYNERLILEGLSPYFVKYGRSREHHRAFLAAEAAAEKEEEVVVFCDLKGGVKQWIAAGAVAYAGSPFHRFNLWLHNYEDLEDQRAIARFIDERYRTPGRGYVYVSGRATLCNGTPQISLDSADQLSDVPPGGRRRR